MEQLLQEEEQRGEEQQDSPPIPVAADLSEYVRALTSTGGSGGRQGEGEGDAAARSAAEGLAMMALRHEHDNRRRFMAASTSAAKAKAVTAPSASSSGASAAAAAVAAREAASIRHRLLHTLPDLLLKQAQPATSLLLYSPPAPASAQQHQPDAHHSSSAATKQQQQQQQSRGSAASAASTTAASADGFRLRLHDGLSRMQWADWSHPQLAMHTWGAFFGRWLACSGNQPEDIWQELAQSWGTEAGADPGRTSNAPLPSPETIITTPAAVLETMPLAVAALCAVMGHAGAGARMEWALGKVLEHIRPGGGR